MQNGRGEQRFALDDETRVLALLATAYEQQPAGAHVLAKIGRACVLWNVGEKALAHIHLAHAGLPPCGEVQALRLFVADELIKAGATPAALMKASACFLTALRTLASCPPLFHKSGQPTENRVPSLIRFLVIAGILAGLVYGGMIALVTFVEPQPREMSQSISPALLNK